MQQQFNMVMCMICGTQVIQPQFLTKAISRYIICYIIKSFCVCLQATGKDKVSGSFTIIFPGEKFKIEFNFTAGKNPTFSHTKSGSGDHSVQVLSEPTFKNLSSHVSFQIFWWYQTWKTITRTRSTFRDYKFILNFFFFFCMFLILLI